jgi:hypothetical protein
VAGSAQRQSVDDFVKQGNSRARFRGVIDFI